MRPDISNIHDMGRGGVGICSVPCNRRVTGSNLPQVTAYRSSQVAHP